MRSRARDGACDSPQVLMVVLFAVPSTIVGVGLIGLWNRPGLWVALRHRCDAPAGVSGSVRSSGYADPGGSDADRLDIAGGGSRCERCRLAPDGSRHRPAAVAGSELAPPGSSHSCWRSASWAPASSWHRRVGDTADSHLHDHRQHAVFQRGHARAIAIGGDLCTSGRVRRGRLHA